MEEKLRKAFEKQAMYMGNGIYSIAGLYSTDTAELWTMFYKQQLEVENGKERIR